MRPKRIDGGEQPGFPWGPFTPRVPFYHMRMEWAEFLQGIFAPFFPTQGSLRHLETVMDFTNLRFAPEAPRWPVESIGFVLVGITPVGVVGR